jgi:hypothetical protein
MFDPQSLVLLGYMRLNAGDRKALQRCVDDIQNILERNDATVRLQRLNQVLQIMLLIQDHQTARVLEGVRGMMATSHLEGFDFEAACNLLMLLGLLAQRAIQLDEVEDHIQLLGLRFCTSKALTELLAKAVVMFPPYAEKLLDIHGTVLSIIEKAMRQSLAGNPKAATVELLEAGTNTRNAKIIESAWGVLKRYETRIEGAAEVSADIQGLRSRYNTIASKPVIGDKNLRQSGGVSLRVMDAKSAETTPA